MKKTPTLPRRKVKARPGPVLVRGGRLLNRLVENDLIRRVNYDTYREKVRDVYDGPQGAILATCSKLSLHEPLMERLLRDRKFDLRGAKTILDVGSGAGQILKHLMRFADRDACITGIDLSHKMLLRARQRLRARQWLRGRRPGLSVADITRLPFADRSFDCVTCGYVLEHLPDARHGLAELARVLRPGGRMLLLTSEDNFGGAWTSRLWRCRTYNRRELFKICHEVGLDWRRELWLSPVHKVLRAGGICVEIERRG
ncbi:MAG: class I SAM-dependent methyltransferase [Pirellulales bacterium]